MSKVVNMEHVFHNTKQTRAQFELVNHFAWLGRRCFGTNSVLQSIKIHSWHHRGDPALGRLRCCEGHLDIPETGCCICDVVTDATTCFSSRWPWQRPLTPGRSWHSKTLKSLQITVLKAVYGSRLWTIWVWCFQSEMWSPITSGVDSASLTLGVEFYTIVIYYDFVQSRVNLPFHTVSLHFPFEFEGQLGSMFCRRYTLNSPVLPHCFSQYDMSAFASAFLVAFFFFFLLLLLLFHLHLHLLLLLPPSPPPPLPLPLPLHLHNLLLHRRHVLRLLVLLFFFSSWLFLFLCSLFSACRAPKWNMFATGAACDVQIMSLEGGAWGALNLIDVCVWFGEFWTINFEANANNLHQKQAQLKLKFSFLNSDFQSLPEVC